MTNTYTNLSNLLECGQKVSVLGKSVQVVGSSPKVEHREFNKLTIGTLGALVTM